jgi:hypothetical protein
MALLALATCINMVLTVMLIRRLRSHLPELFGSTNSRGVIAVGESVPEFGVTLLSDEEFDQATVATGTHLVAIYSTSCSVCRPTIPDYVQRAADLGPGGRGVAFVVDDGDESERAALLATLGETVEVAVVRHDSHAIRAFESDGYPTFVLVQDGIVAASGHSLFEIPGQAAHAAVR